MAFSITVLCSTFLHLPIVSQVRVMVFGTNSQDWFLNMIFHYTSLRETTTTELLKENLKLITFIKEMEKNWVPLKKCTFWNKMFDYFQETKFQKIILETRNSLGDSMELDSEKCVSLFFLYMSLRNWGWGFVATVGSLDDSSEFVKLLVINLF